MSSKEKHPPGLYVLFFTEMWERFGFYTMAAMFLLYLRNPEQGFGWTAESAIVLWSWYLMFVYASPLIGGWIADRGLGYRNSVLIGGVIFMVGYLLFTIHAIEAVYAALVCLVVGNGFFKPNVSAMVGHLYPEGSPLKDRAYNIFYMGINIGALLAPLVGEVMVQQIGYRAGFAIAGLGMIASIAILWSYKQYVDVHATLPSSAQAAGGHFQPQPGSAGQPAEDIKAPTPDIKGPGGVSAGTLPPPIEDPGEAAVTEDIPPREGGARPVAAVSAMESVPESRRVGALIVIFLIVIVFWMVFHQNGSTLTYWADENTDWHVSGIIANAINPFWVVALTLPLVWFWNWLNQRGMEPSTPMKMALGMFMTAASFALLYGAARIGEDEKPRPELYGTADFRLRERSLERMEKDGVPAAVIEELRRKQDGKYIVFDKKFTRDDKGTGLEHFEAAVGKVLTPEQLSEYRGTILEHAWLFKMSPLWLIFAFMIVTLGELMLSPMGLSLVSKVAPVRMRGLMMGGWFVATAIGNKLTAIGVYYDRWPQSTFFILLAGMAAAMGVVLLVLLRPLKKAMPGV
jgi:POT family proton-dependent oligopeptide transporter